MTSAELGCLESHLNVLCNSKTDFVLMLEDDFEFCENFDNKLEQCLKQLPNDFDALWLGGRLFGNRSEYSNDLLKISNITGTYGYLINRTSIPRAIESLSRRNKLADYALSNAFLNAFKTKENLVKHKAGFSIIKGKNVDYKDLR